MIYEILLSLFYFILFVWLIHQWSFFKHQGLKPKEISFIFAIKSAAGIILTLIYTYYYKERSEADIFKFFDDSAFIYQALFINPIHYLQLVFGINAEAPHLSVYVENTRFWALHTDAYWQFTQTENNNFFHSHRLVTQFNAVLRLFSFGYFTVHTVFMCFISLLGQMALYKSLFVFFKNKNRLFIISIFFMPSVLLWSSGVLKEGFIFFGLGFYLYYFFKITHDKINIRRGVFLALSFTLIVLSKYYLAAVLIPASMAYYISQKIKQKPSVIYFIIYSIVFISILAAPSLSTRFPNVLKILSEKQSALLKENEGGYYLLRNNNEVKEVIYIPPQTEFEKIILDSARNTFTIKDNVRAFKYENGLITDKEFIINDSLDLNVYYWEIFGKARSGSLITVSRLEPNIRSFLLAIPRGLYNVICRPHFADLKKLILLPALIENIFICIILLICFVFGSLKSKNYNLLLFLLSITISLYIVIGITTPVLGSIVRYKAPFLPLLMAAFVYIIDKERLNNFIVKFKEKWHI